MKVDDQELRIYADILGCNIGTFLSIYLGLPLCLARTPKFIWNLVIERVENRLSAWKASYLSFSSRITLIQVVLSNLSVYYVFFQVLSFGYEAY